MDHAPFYIIKLPKVADPRGNLSFIQGGGKIPFEIARAYWIYGVPGGMFRQGRALRATTELIVALSGSFDVVLDAGDGERRIVHLCRGYQGLLVEPMVWREIENFSTNSVALVLASSIFSEPDYIRSYDDFLNIKNTPRSLAVSPQDICESAGVSAPTYTTFPHQGICEGAGASVPSSHSLSSLADCGIIDLPHEFDPNGDLTVVENTEKYPFPIRRVFYLYDVPADSERGGHSHHKAQELIVAVSGSFDVTLHDGHRRRTFHLDRPYKALYIPSGIWRTLGHFSSGSVCLVLTSEKYDEADYVRSFTDFMRLTAEKTAPAKHYPFLDLAVCNAPYISELRDAALSVIDSGRYIGGGEVAALERDLSSLTGAPFAVGVSNGLDALRLIFRGYIELGRLRPGDEVIVPANTYIASVLAVTDCGLKPVFVEPSPATLNLDSSLVEAAISPRTRAVLPVHLYGRACWDDTLASVVRRHDLIVVEDNAQAIGAEASTNGLFGNRFTGALGHAAAFSFYPTKNIGALGDAGAVTTFDEKLARAVRALSNYGSDRRYHNIYDGFNCRLDPIQAAMIRVKLRHIDDETDHRRLLAAIYSTAITNPKVILPLRDDPDNSVWHQYVVRVPDRDAFRRYLLDHGVETDVHYAVPPHLQPCYSGYASLDLPVTCSIADTVVSLPVSRCTTESDAREIAAIINGY